MRSQLLWYPINTRYQGVLQTESVQEENRMKLISGIVRRIVSDPDKDKFIEELQISCDSQYTHLSEDAKMKIWLRGNTEGFELHYAICSKKFNVLTACDTQRQSMFIAGVGPCFLKM